MLCVEMRSAVAWLDSPCGSRGSARLILLRFVRLDKSNPWTGDVAKPRDRSGDPRKLLKAKPLLEASLSLTGFAGRTHWPKDMFACILVLVLVGTKDSKQLPGGLHSAQSQREDT
ncbi:predicted protein [Histoplasma capsulatum var. duboisii H88]|uniref:Predicted protein n=1 Tax=Ajellomyces capsulatus (strain H88) TaxID=544711 RepID=F0UNL8_AJEC8|nr:predicted protein [Histoplasma capsulatum var. duboisii H88]